MKYVIELDDQDFPVLSAALGELPYRVAAPLVERINAQIDAQRRARSEASEDSEKS